MSELRQALDQYLALRRSLGFQLRQVSATLRSFVAFAEGKGASYITIDLMLQMGPTAEQSAAGHQSCVAGDGTALCSLAQFLGSAHRGAVREPPIPTVSSSAPLHLQG